MKAFDYPIIPMEPIPHEDIFDSPDYLFQTKWDGVRCLTYAVTGLELFNRRKNRRTEQYPELVEALSFIPPGTVLDGEIVALNEKGLPDFPRILKRDLLKNSQSIKAAQRSVPIQYIVFDMPYLRGDSLCGTPLAERMELLRETVTGKAPIACIDSVERNGSALFHTVKGIDMEGIVAKRKDSRYLIGEKSAQWLKIKAWRDIEAHILGYSEENGAFRSLVLGVVLNGALRYIGNASSGLTEAHKKALRQRAIGVPRGAGFPENTKWIAPGLLAKLRYLEWTPAGRLRNPSVSAIFPSGEVP